MSTRRTTPRSGRRSLRALRRLAVAETRKRPMRAVVTVGTVALGAAALTSALTVGATVQQAVDSGLKVEYTNIDVMIRSDVAASGDSAVGAATASDGIRPDVVAALDRLPAVTTTGTYARASAVARAGSASRAINLESLATSKRFQWQQWSEGRAPRSDGEIGLSSVALSALKIRLGDLVSIGTARTGRANYRVVGVVDTRGSLLRQESAYGIVTTSVAQTLAGLSAPNTLLIDAKPGADTDALIAEINRVAPVGIPQSIDDILSAGRDVQLAAVNALSAVVAALAGLSCLIAAITSATTTGASLASRRRTWALIRCVGGGRRQIGLLVAAESTVLGLLGAVVGVVVGLAVARISLPLLGLIPGVPPVASSSFTVTGTALVLPVVVSVVLAVLGALVPAIVAARIPPSSALKATMAGQVSRARRSVVIGSTAVIGGSLGGYVAAARSEIPVLIGCCAVVVVGSGLLLRPLLASVASVLARRARSMPVRLGFSDIARRPRAATIEAVAVALAVGLIALSWVALSSVQQATSARLSSSPMPDVIVGSVAGSAPLSASAVRRIDTVPGVAESVPVRFGAGIEITGRGSTGPVVLAVGTAAAAADDLARVLPEGFPVTRLRDDTVYIPVSAFPPFYADSRVRITGPDGSIRRMSVSYVEGLQVPSLVSPAVMERLSRTTTVQLDWVRLERGADRGGVIDRISGIVLLDQQQPVSGPAILDLKAASALSAARAAAVAILSLGVLVAVIGAAATAGLSIAERARQHATLRALGLPRRELARMLGARVLLVAVSGAGLGVVAGGALGVVLARAIVAGLGLAPVTTVPLLPIAVVVAASVLAVRLAALVPMERASYIPPSRALAES